MNDIHEPEENAGSDVDPGEPIRELAELEDAAAPGFFQQLINRIDRRLLGGDMIELGWQAIREFFFAYWSLLVSIVAPGEKDDGGAKP